MRFTVDSVLLAALALSAAQTGLAAPLSGSPGSPLVARSDSDPSSGAGNPLATLEKHLPAPDGGLSGILSSARIINDHIKFTMNPPSALEPIPAAENSPPRELHREAHVAISYPGQKPASS